MTLLILFMGVAGSMECSDNEEVAQFAKEWQAIPCPDGSTLWVRVGAGEYGYKDSLQLVQSARILLKRR
jgi:hypothetical protein